MYTSAKLNINLFEAYMTSFLRNAYLQTFSSFPGIARFIPSRCDIVSGIADVALGTIMREFLYYFHNSGHFSRM